MNSNDRKNAQLGMPFGTANNKLRKLVLFDLLERHGENICYRCDKPIEFVDELSMDHKEPWLGSDTALYWDLDNIAFAHSICNNRAGRRVVVRYCPNGHDTFQTGRYNDGHCKKCNSQRIAKYRAAHSR